MKEPTKEPTKGEMKKTSGLEVSISSVIGSLSIEFVNVYKKTLSLEVFSKIRKETIDLLTRRKIKIIYPSYYQYTFIKLFYKTAQEEIKALKIMGDIKKIINKYGEN